MRVFTLLLLALWARALDVGLVSEGVGRAFDGSFEEAEVFFEQGLSDRPELLKFFRQWAYFSAHKSEKKEIFERGLEAETVRFQAARPKSPDSLLLEGMWNGLLALCRVESGSLLPAYRCGRHAYEALKKTLTLDPEKYDCYYGLGLYHKMKYELSAEAWFVPASDRDLALARKYLLKASEKGLFTRELAEAALLELSFVEP